MRLFYEDCPFPCVRASEPDTAAELIRSGETVLVLDASTAIDTLIVLGLSRDSAAQQLSWLTPRK